MWVICGLREKFYEGGDGEREKAEGYMVEGEGTVNVGGLWAEVEVL